MESVFTAFTVLSKSPVIGADALSKALVVLSQLNPTPILLPRFILEVTKHQNLGQFVCNQILPALASKQMWTEGNKSERWRGFILLAKKYGVAGPTNCLQTLLTIPPKPLKDILRIAPDIKPVLVDFAQRQLEPITPEVKALLGLP